jgi:hypothetical protein
MWSAFKSKPQPQYERRGYRRDPIVAPARIVLSNGRYYECTTENLSQSGAKLILPGVNLLPKEFEVVVPERHIQRKARLVWRDQDSIGVQFV